MLFRSKSKVFAVSSRAGGAGSERCCIGAKFSFACKKRTRDSSRAGGAGDVFLSVKWLCAPRGPEVELVFSLSWFSRRWRGAVFSLAVKWLCAPRGPEVGRGVSNPPSLPLDSTLPATS